MPLRQGNSGDMAMNRRIFIHFITAVLLTPPSWITQRINMPVYTEAERTRHYTGPIKELDISSINKPGRWAG
jgi:hypothetical protein